MSQIVVLMITVLSINQYQDFFQYKVITKNSLSFLLKTIIEIRCQKRISTIALNFMRIIVIEHPAYYTFSKLFLYLINRVSIN